MGYLRAGWVEAYASRSGKSGSSATFRFSLPA